MTPIPPVNPPGPPPGYYAPPPREGRPVSFYVAIFLALLLFISGGLNVLLLLVSAIGSAAGGFGVGVGDDDGGRYEIVTVGGDRRAETSILRLPIEGVIAEEAAPLLGGAGGMVSRVRRALRAAARDESVKGILLDINSPGGGVTDSDEIRRLLLEFKREHPSTQLVALLGDTAASGGYYIAAPCDYIIARPTTITGSIGVIISSYNVAEGLKKIGVEPITIVSEDTPYKDMLSTTRPMRPEEAAKLRAIVQEMYERFVDVVDEGRPELDRDAVKRLATGEIYSARRAEQLGLVDQIGGPKEAQAKLAELIGVGAVRVLEQRRIPNLLDALFESRAAPGLERLAAGLLRTTTGPRLLYYWPGGR